MLILSLVGKLFFLSFYSGWICSLSVPEYFNKVLSIPGTLPTKMPVFRGKGFIRSSFFPAPPYGLTFTTFVSFISKREDELMCGFCHASPFPGRNKKSPAIQSWSPLTSGYDYCDDRRCWLGRKLNGGPRYNGRRRTIVLNVCVGRKKNRSERNGTDRRPTKRPSSWWPRSLR